MVTALVKVAPTARARPVASCRRRSHRQSEEETPPIGEIQWLGRKKISEGPGTTRRHSKEASTVGHARSLGSAEEARKSQGARGLGRRGGARFTERSEAISGAQEKATKDGP